MDAGKAVLGRITAAVEALHPGDSGVTVRYAGALPMNQEQNTWMNQDIRGAALISLGLIALVIALAFRRLVAPLILGIPLLLGIAGTLAIARLLYGQLNLVSGFLISTLFGLGIDYGLHLYLRYTEHLTGGAAPRVAMTEAMVETLRGSNTAALTTVAAFIAVATSAFRGFQEFGTIAALGIALTLLTTYVTLPPLAILLVRRPPRGRVREHRGDIPRALAWSVVAASLICTAVAVDRGGVRWQGDFDALRGRSELVDFSHAIEVEQGGVLAPALLRVPDEAATRWVDRYLAERAADPSSEIRRSLSLMAMVPSDPAASMAILADLRRDLDQLHDADLDASDRAHVAEVRRLAAAKPWRPSDIPEAFRGPLEPLSGTGALIAVWPRSYMATERDVLAWSEALRRVQREAGEAGIHVEVLDENLLAAKVLDIAQAEVPQVLWLAALAVLFIVIVDFRRVLPVVMIVGSLALGILWMVGVMGVFGIELNVFNQAVLPTIVGMGLDNAIHLEHRYAALGRGSLGRVLRTTGFAGLLAALTTAIGFGSTLWARHAGVRSMGELAVAGFICTFFAGTVLLPMARRLMEGLSRRKVIDVVPR